MLLLLYDLIFFGPRGLASVVGPLYLTFHFARVVCKYLPISLLLLLYRRKRVPIVSARVPGRPAAVYYITLHYYDCCYYTMFGTRV